MKDCQIQHFALDLANAKSVKIQELLIQAANSFGRVDVFVSNAGTGHSKLLIGTPLEELDELLESQISTNLLASVRCATAAAQLMAADGRGGRISIVSSACGLISLPGYAIYSATKFGHRGFLAGAFHELQQHGVLLSVYYPGSLRTPGYAAEQEDTPLVTAKIESQCSDLSSAEDAALMLLKGIQRGDMEITNELLPSLVVDHPSGCAPVDMVVGAVVQLFRAIWFLYLRLMSSYYVKAPTASGSRSLAASSSSQKRA